MRGRDSWVRVSSPGPRISNRERQKDTRKVDAGTEGPMQSLTLSEKGSRRDNAIIQSKSPTFAEELIFLSREG